MNKEIQEKLQVFQQVLENVPEITYAGNPVLREQAQEVSVEEGVEIAKRLEDVLIRCRKIAGYGRGIAAPQIGENKSVLVTYVDNKTQIFINPKIIEKSETTNFYKELCLSAGIVAADVERSEWIVMDWTDEYGEKHSEKFDGFLARLYQHEEAHLRGRINIDDAVDGGIELLTFDPLKEQLRADRQTVNYG